MAIGSSEVGGTYRMRRAIELDKETISKRKPVSDALDCLNWSTDFQMTGFAVF